MSHSGDGLAAGGGDVGFGLVGDHSACCPAVAADSDACIPWRQSRTPAAAVTFAVY